jgi:hypothetical protein
MSCLELAIHDNLYLNTSNCFSHLYKYNTGGCFACTGTPVQIYILRTNCVAKHNKTKRYCGLIYCSGEKYLVMELRSGMKIGQLGQVARK